MFKAKHFLIFVLPIFLTSFISTKAFATEPTFDEREDRVQTLKEYAQNHILFYKPCYSEEECNQSNANAEAADPVDPGPSDSTPSPSPGGDGGSGDKGDPFTPSGSGAALIVSTARAMSWPTSAGTCRDSSGNYVGWLPTSMNKNAACQNTMSDYLKSIGVTGLMRDCGKFVGTVMRKSVDPNFQASGVKYQIPYMKKSSNWAKVSTDGQVFSMANLKPGDVLAFSENGNGHIVIWLGNQTVPCKSGRCPINIASSSQGTRTPSLNKLTKMKQCNGSGECFLYQVFRWVGA